MSEQQPDNEPLKNDTSASDSAANPSSPSESSTSQSSTTEPSDKPSLADQSAAATLALSPDSKELTPQLVDEHPAVKIGPHEVEWIPGEELELIKIPPPTIWPATLALGTTGIAFGVVTHWILSAAGLFLFLLGAAGWIEDMRKDVLQ